LKRTVSIHESLVELSHSGIDEISDDTDDFLGSSFDPGGHIELNEEEGSKSAKRKEGRLDSEEGESSGQTCC